MVNLIKSFLFTVWYLLHALKSIFYFYLFSFFRSNHSLNKSASPDSFLAQIQNVAGSVGVIFLSNYQIPYFLPPPIVPSISISKRLNTSQLD